MSAINIIRTTEAVHVLTDGAGWGKGPMPFLVSKAFPLPNLNAVVAVSGRASHTPLLSSALAMSATTYDEMRVDAVDLIREAAERYRPFFGPQAEHDGFVVAVGGISESDGPDAFVVTNDPRVAPPWTLQPIGGCTMIPADAAALEAFRASFAGIADSDDLDPIKHGMRMFEIQRDNPSFGVGGFAQLTTVTKDAITIRVIHRWHSTAHPRQADAA